ncbi:MAG: ABC transporter ATP-binding protein [Proteobacteria bacterium]|nr:ABC transporter ATP-binding protein [Pseudomonadota bacterium]MDA1072109.1 ABC transporter ATP-binding protein [Pseudomonadota bacterium]
MSAPLLVLDGVCSGYDDTMVLQGVSLEVPEGKVISVLGPNGHGKSTLLRTISGLLRLRGGSIHFDGQQIDRWRVDQIVGAGIVHIPQGDLVFPQMTVKENLYLGAYLADAHKRRGAQLEHVYRLFPRLKEREGQVASTLSGGERRMLALGRGLMSRARLLMIDEPSLGLAPLITEEIYDNIRGLKEEGYAILLVEENPERVLETADHIHLIDHGSVVWQGSARELEADDSTLSTYLGA